MIRITSYNVCYTKLLREIIHVEGIENADAQRSLVTDLNGDNIDDIVLYDPTNTIWLGNGDFTFTDASSKLPKGFVGTDKMMGATDIDIDNDGDFDLYFARGDAFSVGNKPSFDFYARGSVPQAPDIQ